MFNLFIALFRQLQFRLESSSGNVENKEITSDEEVEMVPDKSEVSVRSDEVSYIICLNICACMYMCIG